VKIYPKGNLGQGGHSIQTMLEAFEDKQNLVRQANVIILKVESDEKDRAMSGDDGGRGDTGYIVGGYASHGWSAKFPTSGDDSSFLFNLT